MSIQFIQDAFRSARDNMAFDVELAQTRSGLWIRLYRWQYPGITYPLGRANGSDTWGFDHSVRPSGGGILFHSPDALVLGIAADLDDPNFPTPIKHKLKSVTQWIAEGIQAIGIPVVSDCSANAPPAIQDTAFCNTYHNPYELQYNGQKVVGLAVRRWKNRLLIQGIIHTQSNHDDFANVASPQHLSFGLGLNSDQINALETALQTGVSKTFRPC